MTDQNKPEHVLSRRDALKTLAAATGATALATLPGKWETPALEVGALPAFAQASPTNAPFTSFVEVGQPGSGVRPQENRGWIAVMVNNGQVQGLQSASDAQAQSLPIIIPPIPVNQRNFGAPRPGWIVGSTLTLSYTFVSTENVFPVDGTELILYGINGDFYLHQRYEATITATVVNRVVVFNFDLPTGYSGIFYFSANFVETRITLTNTVEFDIRYYQAIAIYAELSFYNEPPSDQPILIGGLFDVYPPVNSCDMGDGGALGSQTILNLTYTGGNVTAGTIIHLLTLFFPSLNLSQVDTPNVTFNPPVISTIDHCIRFSGNNIIYLTVWITDADGQISNSLGGYFLATGLNSTDE